MNASAGQVPNPPFFGGKKWVFWLVAFLPALTLLLSFLLFECTKNGNWLAPMLLTIMVMACLWEAHVQAIHTHPQNGLMGLWWFCKRALRTLLRVAFAGLLPLVPLGIILPQYACYTDRARVSEAVVMTSKSRQEINERASINKTLKGAGLGLEFPKLQGSYPSKGFILEDGVIVLVMEKPPAAVLFTPKMVDANSGAIEWSCRGYPAKSMPTKCREPQ